MIMVCKQCASVGLSEFRAEINIHWPGLQNVEMPSVLMFPKIAVCLHCGFTEFIVPGDGLRLLAEGTSFAARSDESLKAGKE
jgi:hypothetical protein